MNGCSSTLQDKPPCWGGRYFRITANFTSTGQQFVWDNITYSANSFEPSGSFLPAGNYQYHIDTVRNSYWTTDLTARNLNVLVGPTLSFCLPSAPDTVVVTQPQNSCISFPPPLHSYFNTLIEIPFSLPLAQQLQPPNLYPLPGQLHKVLE